MSSTIQQLSLAQLIHNINEPTNILILDESRFRKDLLSVLLSSSASTLLKLETIKLIPLGNWENLLRYLSLLEIEAIKLEGKVISFNLFHDILHWADRFRSTEPAPELKELPISSSQFNSKNLNLLISKTLQLDTYEACEISEYLAMPVPINCALADLDLQQEQHWLQEKKNYRYTSMNEIFSKWI